MFEFLNRRKRRWGDINYHWGIFTWSPNGTYRHVGISYRTSCEEDKGSYIKIAFWWWTLLIESPNFIEPYKEWVDLTDRPWNKDKEGSSGYWDVKDLEWGVDFTNTHMHAHWRYNHLDSWPASVPGSKNICWEYPFLAYTFVRKSWYTPIGKHFATLWEDSRYRNDWDTISAIEDRLEKVQYEIIDYDGEKNIATCHIEEWEWHRGDRSFRWLKYFTKPLIKRSVEINLQKELGPEKGSWKGGLMGTSINMLPGESIDDAFKRWCDEEHPGKYKNYRVKLIRKIEPEKVNKPDDQCGQTVAVNS